MRISNIWCTLAWFRFICSSRVFFPSPMLISEHLWVLLSSVEQGICIWFRTQVYAYLLWESCLERQKEGGRTVNVLVGLRWGLGNLNSVICSAAEFLCVFQKIPVLLWWLSFLNYSMHIKILALLPVGPMTLNVFKGCGALKYPVNKMRCEGRGRRSPSAHWRSTYSSQT